MVRFCRTLAVLPLAHVVTAIRDQDVFGSLDEDNQATSGGECIPALSWCDTGSEKCCTPTEGHFAGQLYQCQAAKGITSDKTLCQGVYAMKPEDTCPEGHKKCSIYCCEAGFGCSDTGNCATTKSNTTSVEVKDDVPTPQEPENSDQDDVSTPQEPQNNDQVSVEDIGALSEVHAHVHTDNSQAVKPAVSAKVYSLAEARSMIFEAISALSNNRNKAASAGECLEPLSWCTTEDCCTRTEGDFAGTLYQCKEFGSGGKKLCQGVYAMDGNTCPDGFETCSIYCCAAGYGCSGGKCTKKSDTAPAEVKDDSSTGQEVVENNDQAQVEDTGALSQVNAHIQVDKSQVLDAQQLDQAITEAAVAFQGQQAHGDECLEPYATCITGKENCCVPTEGMFAGAFHVCQLGYGNKDFCGAIFASELGGKCPENSIDCSGKCCAYGCDQYGFDCALEGAAQAPNQDSGSDAPGQDVQEDDEPDVDVDGNQDDGSDGSDGSGQDVPETPDMPGQNTPGTEDEDAEKPKTYKRHTYRRYR